MFRRLARVEIVEDALAGVLFAEVESVLARALTRLGAGSAGSAGPDKDDSESSVESSED